MPEVYLILASLFVAALVAFLWRGGMTLATCAGWVILTCIYGLLFKPLFVYFNFPSAELLDVVLFERVSREEYWRWGTLALLGYVFFFASMAVAGNYRRKARSERLRQRLRYFNTPSLYLFMVPALAGLVGFFLQFPQLLGSDNKNAVASTDLEDYNGGGIWRVLVELSYLVSLCALVNIGARVARRSNVLLFVCSAGLWLLFCYISDQRGSMLFAIVTYLIAYNRYVGALSRSSVAGATVVAFGLVVVKTVARLQAGGVALQESLAGTISNFIGQNLIENGKTITIIKSVPQLLDFQWGFTYLNAILVLVPRSLFPGKTSVNLDTTIGNKIFECNAFGACGVPPGLLAESYLNFGVIGLVLMPVLAGWLIGRIDAAFRDAPRGAPFDIFYLVSLLYLGMAFLGAGLSSSITSIITESISVAVVCLFCARKLRGGLRGTVKRATVQLVTRKAA